MAGAPKRPTHRVIKSMFFSSTKEPDKVGTQLTLTKDQAAKLTKRGFVEALKDAKVVDATGADAEALEKAKNEAKEAKAALTGANKDIKAKDKEIADLTKKLEKAEADLKAANDALVAKSTGNAG